ncbi:TadE/TadG family type IV pilus assembly protein [uncultured Sphingomonas sp.]|jgi:Flp pilus assembly protein TadG|uniref:TadE/TadG family type IV pilus assembly protein n=1 Tax=unclassified Sphingomonas TaxID=196159 RepID=UPI0025D6B038|nr:TadE/TadG family type IV pilus assembly protein [uncultured Sphingomonas sp.]
MRRLASDTRGATILEFALIIPVVCTLLAAGFELGYRVYLNSILQGALLEASRRATVGDQTGDQIDQIIKDRVAMLSNAANVKEIKKESFYNFTNVGKPEKLTFDKNNNGIYDAADDCYEDANNNNQYDVVSNSGLGTADDIVRYTVRVEYPNIMPVNGLLGWGRTQTISASTVLRNQPFTSRAMPTIRCP